MKRSIKIALLISGITFGTTMLLDVKRLYNDHLEKQVITNAVKQLNIQLPYNSWIIKNNNEYRGEIDAKNERFHFKANLNGKILSLD